MNQLTDPYEEIENRLAICCEFLMDRKKPIEEAYESLMGKIGWKIMEYTEFEYWFKRFQNNQFDLGHDTSQDEKQIQKEIGLKIDKVEGLEAENVAVIPNLEYNTSQDKDEIFGIQNKDDSSVIMEKKASVKIVKRNLPLHQFNEKNVSEIFQTLINRQSKKLREIEVCFAERYCIIKLDKIRIQLKKKIHDLTIRYAGNDTIVRTNDPEKSIIEHLWFVLRDPDIKLERFGIYDCRNPEWRDHPLNLDFEELNSLLQSMLNTFNHQIHTSWLNCNKFNEDTFLSMLRKVKPGTLEYINFDISWKEEGNYQKMKEIVVTDQWKHAKQIFSSGVTPLKIDNFLKCEMFSLRLDRITPEDVLRVTEHVLNSAGSKYCTLSSRNEHLDIDAIRDVLRSRNDGAEITETLSCIKGFRFKIVKPAKYAFLFGTEDYITIQNQYYMKFSFFFRPFQYVKHVF